MARTHSGCTNHMDLRRITFYCNPQPFMLWRSSSRGIKVGRLSQSRLANKLASTLPSSFSHTHRAFETVNHVLLHSLSVLRHSSERFLTAELREQSAGLSRRWLWTILPFSAYWRRTAILIPDVQWARAIPSPSFASQHLFVERRVVDVGGVIAAMGPVIEHTRGCLDIPAHPRAGDSGVTAGMGPVIEHTRRCLDTPAHPRAGDSGKQSHTGGQEAW
jgi:hypothetical protein